jgi:menaquinone-dependent protoporphyrinogen oxidase
MANILIVYGTFAGHTGKIAECIGAALRARQHEVSVYDGKLLPPGFMPHMYDAALFGASVHMAQHEEYIVQLVKAHRAWLNQVPSAFFSVSLMRGGQLIHHRSQAEEYLRTFLADVEWRPMLTATFGGALPFSKYNFAQRFITAALARRALGAINPNRDSEYTIWDDVVRFADDFLATWAARQS